MKAGTMSVLPSAVSPTPDSKLLFFTDSIGTVIIVIIMKQCPQGRGGVTGVEMSS